MRAGRFQLSLANKPLFYTGLLLAVMPVWVFEYLPGADLPGHAAQIAALHEIWRGNPVFTDLFDINLATPYLTVTTISALLAYLVPVNIAIKLLLTTAVISTPLLFQALAREVGSSPDWGWLVLPSTFSFAFYWGFLPFIASVPLGLAFLLLAIRFNERQTLALGVAVAVMSIVLLVSHLLVLCFSSMLALAWIISSNRHDWRRAVMMTLPLATPVPLIALWLIGSMSSGTYMSNTGVVFGSMIGRLYQLLIQPSGLDGRYLIVSAAITAVVVGLPPVTGARLTKSPAKWAMAISGFVVFMTFPSLAMGTAFLYQRFGLFLPLLWLLLWEKGPDARGRWHWLGMAAVLCWIGVVSYQLHAFNAGATRFDRIADLIEPGQRVASFPVVNQSPSFAYPSYLHFPSWYQARSQGVVDFNFGLFYGTMVTYKSESRPPFSDRLTWQPALFDWERNAGDRYDYFIVHADEDVGQAIFKDRLAAVELVATEGWWWLYRRKVRDAEASRYDNSKKR